MEVFQYFLERYGFPIAVCVWLAIRVEKRLDKIQEHTEFLPLIVKLFALMQGLNPKDLEPLLTEETGLKDVEG